MSLPHTSFTPVETLLGGYLLHLATSTLLEDNGTVLGISGIVDGAIYARPPSARVHADEKGEKAKQQWVEKWYRQAILAGMLVGPISLDLIQRALGREGTIGGAAYISWAAIGDLVGIGRIVGAGLLVGLGSRLGSGCTSGHFLCGSSRLSIRSIIATATFFPIAMLTASFVPLYPSSPKNLSAPSYKPTYPSSEDLLNLAAPFVIFFAPRSLLRRVLTRRNPSSIARLLPYALCGWTFSAGLIMSGMADPIKVISFVELFPIRQWDPSLAMVFLSGVIPNAIHYRRLMKSSSASPRARYSWAEWRVPSRKDIDWRLILGAAVFGVGWGLGGVCPGPAVVGLGSVLMGNKGDMVASAVKAVGGFMGGMILGMKLGRSI